MSKPMAPPLHGLTAAVAAGALAACSSSGGEESADERDVITVGVQPMAELAPFYIAQDLGLFEEQGIEVEVHEVSEGATLVATMVSGETPIIYANYVSLLTAVDQELPVRVFRENDRPGVQALYVMPDSQIEEPEDFDGATIAVSGLGNVMEITARAALDHHGVDLGTVEFVEFPPPNMQAALEEGQVDAAWLVEPFVTLAAEEVDARPVVSAFEGAAEEAPVAGWATSAQFLDDDPQAVAAFKDALDEAMEIAVSDSDAVAEIIPTYSEMSPEIAASITMPSYAPDSDLSGLSIVQDMMIDYDVIDEAADLNSVIVEADELE